MTKKNVVTESKEIQRAIELIKLGARLQLLESETFLRDLLANLCNIQTAKRQQK